MPVAKIHVLEGRYEERRLTIPSYIDLCYPEVGVARSSLPERALRTGRPDPDVVRHPRITTVFVPSAGAGDRP